jgi:hypothetical protein
MRPALSKTIGIFRIKSGGFFCVRRSALLRNMPLIADESFSFMNKTEKISSLSLSPSEMHRQPVGVLPLYITVLKPKITVSRETGAPI